jgi:replicative DNA helicase
MIGDGSYLGNGSRWHPTGVNAWLRQLGVFGQRSQDKRIPDEVFRLDDQSVASLLRHLWATDGCIHVGEGGAEAICYSTASEGLARDVAALLLRFAIVARIREVQQGRYRPAYHVHVYGAANERRFLETVGAFGPREAPAARLAAALDGRQARTNVDTLPKEVFLRVRDRMVERGISQRRMTALRGTSYGGTSHFRFAPSRAVVMDYAEILDDEGLRSEARSDRFWDRVLAVEPAGEQDVFDLTVPATSAWLADGIVSHNSGSIEQDADVICFLFRKHYYTKAESDRGTAEVIVAKQRNGPTDTVQVAFLDQFMRFDNLALPSQREG